MPISSQIPIVGYVANGVTTTFTFPFVILSSDDLKVTVNNAPITTGFSIAGVGDRDGGSVTFAAPPAAATPIILYREVALNRTTDFQENGDLLAAVLDDDFDRLWLAIQDQSVTRSRALQVPLDETVNPIPKASERALKALGFNALGQPIALSRTDDGGATLALELLDTAPGKGAALVGYDGGTAQDVLDDAKPMANYTALRAYTGRATGVRITQAGLAGFFQRDTADTTSADNGGTVIVDGSGRRWKRLFTGPINVLWFGAKGDGATDDTAAIQAAINYCEQTYSASFNTIDSVAGSKTSNWLTLYAPAGLYKLTSTLRVKAPINVVCDGETSTKFIAASGFSATSNNAVVDFSRADGHWLLSQEIRGFSVIDGSNTFVPIYGKYLHNYHIDDVACVGGAYGLLLEGSYSGKIGRISLYKNTVAGRVIGLYSPSTQEANDIHIERIEAYDNGTGLEVGGGLNIYVKGVIQKTNLECVKVVDNLQMLDISGLYLEDWYNSLADYSLSAFAVSTPASGSGKIVGKFIATKVTAVDNKPVIQLDQVVSATITDNYWHNSTTCANIAANTALKSFEYRRNYLKRSGSAAAPGTSPQEFYGYILRNQSSTVFPELYASDFITGNNSTNTGDANFAYGFSGQIANAKCGKLNVDTVVPFSLRYTSAMGSLKVIQGYGPGTGFTNALHHYILDAADLSVSDLKISSSVNTQDAAVGDTATSCYVGGTYNTSQRVNLKNVTFENTDATGVNAVEFGRNFQNSSVVSCYMTTNSTQKAGVYSKNCAYIDLRSNNDSTGTAATNAQTQGNAFINTPSVGASPSGTGNRVL